MLKSSYKHGSGIFKYSLLIIIAVFGLALLLSRYNLHTAIVAGGMGLGAILTYYKLQVDIYNYNLALFEKRFEVYLNIKEIYKCIHRSWSDSERLRVISVEFFKFLDEAEFIFGEISINFIKEMSLKVIKLESYNTEYNNCGSDYERSMYSHENKMVKDELYAFFSQADFKDKFPELLLSL